MKRNLQIFAVTTLSAFILALPATVRADVVSDWNAIAVQAVLTGASPAGPAARVGASGVIDLAMVQGAVYDAVQAIEGKYRPYGARIPGATGSPIAAAAKAAHDVLVNRFPAQAASLDTQYMDYLAANALSPADPGVAVGAAAAAGMIALRAGDGSFPNPAPPPFIGGTAPGQWRPTPPANAPMLAPWMGSVRPFVMRSSSQFRAAPPPALTARQYTRAYDEVKEFGSLTSTSRTADQTDMANFWNANYLVLWNRVLREVSAAHSPNVSESSRLFALADMCMADGIITAWDSKNQYVFWRPITAIQLGDTDGNPRTVGDPTWLPLIPTPPYPDHTSGANNITATATTAMSLIFGDRMTVNVTTTNLVPTILDTRTFQRFSDIRSEVVEARILEGIHFRFADEAARRQGESIALWAFTHHFRRVRSNDDDDDDDHDNDHDNTR